MRRAYYYAEQAHTGSSAAAANLYHPPSGRSQYSRWHAHGPSKPDGGHVARCREDTGIGKQALHDQFGEVVAELVDGVSKLAKIEYESQAEKQAKISRKWPSPWRGTCASLGKMADRLHNMRTLGALAPEKNAVSLKKPLEIYAPSPTVWA